MKQLASYVRQNKLIALFLLIQLQVLLLNAQRFVGSGEQEIPPTISDIDKREGRSWRLPNTTYPLKYYLHITTWIHREILNYTGNVTIEVLVKEDTPELVLHAENLNIEQIQIQDIESQRFFVNLKSRTIDDLLVIEQRDNFVSDSDSSSDSNGESNSNSIEATGAMFVRNQRLRLEIHYTGVINPKNKGFHTMTYEDANNKTVYGAFTQMEPVFARRVLPCYDEPALKANFTVRITHGSNYTAISNMPAISTIENSADNMTTTSFMETPPMCTYLLAFLVSNFNFIAIERDGILQRVFSPPNAEERGELALENAIAAISTFAHYIDIPYTLPKLDHVYVRNAYGSAMENWGLIIYKDVEFIQKNYTSKYKRFRRINTQNHEIVHQWFGNLVSPEWWDSLWLNEGFASYYSHKLMDMMYPDERRMEDFKVANCYPRVYKNLQPVYEYREKPADIIDAFGTTVYQKAPCMIQMFEHAIGKEIFYEAVMSFLKAHAFTSANEDQFFEHLESTLHNASEKAFTHHVSEFMRSWLHGKSLPIVYITRDYSDSSIIDIKQTSSSQLEKELWWIPLNFATASQPNFANTKAIYYMPPISKVTLNLTEFNITLTKDDWLLANVKDTGFYRVFYDNENLLRIAKTLQTNPNVIDNLNRAQVLRSISLENTDGISLVTVLELLKYLPQEEDPLVWSFVQDIIYEIDTLLSCGTSYDFFREFIRNIVAQHYKKYAEMPKDELGIYEPELLGDLSEIACKYNLRECLEHNKQQFMLHKANILEADNDFERMIEVCYAAKLFSDTEFDEVLELLINQTKYGKPEYWRFLRCTSNVAQYEKLLQVWLDTKVNGPKRKDYLDFIIDSLEMMDEKWSSKYKFLKEEMLLLKNDTSSTLSICRDLTYKAEEMCKSHHSEFLELYELCFNQILEDDTDIEEPHELKLGVNFSFQNNTEWELEEKKVYNWLMKENEIYNSKTFK